MPPTDDIPTPEEDLQNSADEDGNTDPSTDEMRSEEIDQITNEVNEDLVNTEEPAATNEPSSEEPVPDGGEGDGGGEGGGGEDGG